MSFLSSGSSGKFSSFRRSRRQVDAQDLAHVTAGKFCPALDGKDVGSVCHTAFLQNTFHDATARSGTASTRYLRKNLTFAAMTTGLPEHGIDQRDVGP